MRVSEPTIAGTRCGSIKCGKSKAEREEGVWNAWRVNDLFSIVRFAKLRTFFKKQYPGWTPNKESWILAELRQLTVVKYSFQLENFI